MKPTRAQIREAARNYLKVVEWSSADQAFLGSAPPIIGHCCHGKTESAVLSQLQRIVEEWVEVFLVEGRPLPDGTSAKEYSGKFVVRIDPKLHKQAALKAMARGDSLNQFVADAIQQAS